MTTPKDKSLLDKAKDLAEDLAETASDLGETAWEKTKDASRLAGDATTGAADATWEASKDAAEKTAELAKEATEASIQAFLVASTMLGDNDAGRVLPLLNFSTALFSSRSSAGRLISYFSSRA